MAQEKLKLMEQDPLQPITIGDPNSPRFGHIQALNYVLLGRQIPATVSEALVRFESEIHGKGLDDGIGVAISAWNNTIDGRSAEEVTELVRKIGWRAISWSIVGSFGFKEQPLREVVYANLALGTGMYLQENI